MALVANLVAVIGGARDAVVGGALLEGAAFDGAVAALAALQREPRAVIRYDVAWAEGTF